MACSEGRLVPTAMGSIRLILTGLHASATSGGTATATPTAGGDLITVNIPPSGDQTAAAPVGTYTVTYTPPANHLVDPSTTVPSQITITEDQTTTVALTLIPTGSMQVTVTGLTGSSGGSASAQRTDAAGTPIPITISAAGTGSATNVPVGTYTVTYTPPSGFNVSTTNPLTGVAVNIGATASTSFTVTTSVSTGTVHVTVTGLTGATAGGSLSARLTNNTGNTFTANLPAPTGGTSAGDLTALPAGSYNVTYTAPSGYRLVAGETNPKVAAVTAGNITNTTFAAEVAPVVGGIIFNSDWSTALGTSSNALLDSSKASPWTISGGAGHEVIASTGLDFPSANVMRVTAQQANSGFATVRKSGMPIPAVGESRWYRWYIRVAIGDGVALSDSETHPHQDGNAASDCNWLFHIYHNDGGAGNWRPQLRPNAAENTFPNDRWFGPALAKNQTFRFELQINRTGASTFQMHARIYNSANVMIHGDSAFTNQQSNATLANNPTFNIHVLNNLDGLNAGLNGLGGSDWFPSVIYMYTGAVAVGNADWIGAYSGGV